MNLTPPTYPLRPVNGGPLPKAQPKHAGPGGAPWFYEPKINGWRTPVHVPTGTMFNRKNERLSIEREFAAALKLLREIFARFPAIHGWNRCEWADCEGLERRHILGKGSLVMLDILDAPPLIYTARNDFLQSFFEPINAVDFVPLGVNEVRCLPRISANAGLKEQTCYPLPEYWEALQAANRRLGCEFYEGVVAKRADSKYPHQLRSASEEFPFWMKHRWAF